MKPHLVRPHTHTHTHRHKHTDTNTQTYTESQLKASWDAMSHLILTPPQSDI